MITEEIYIEDKHQLRSWLDKNHDSYKGIWLVYDKKNSGKRTLSYDELVEEVLCFGWVDSLPRSKNGNQAMYYISPRKPKSPWSKLNKQRIEKLTIEKRIARAGLEFIERSKKDGSWISYDNIENLVVPVELKTAFSKNRKAEENFNNFSNSNKKQILWYISSAKQEETKNKRITQIVAEAAKNNNPLEYRKKKAK